MPGAMPTGEIGFIQRAFVAIRCSILREIPRPFRGPAAFWRMLRASRPRGEIANLLSKLAEERARQDSNLPFDSLFSLRTGDPRLRSRQPTRSGARLTDISLFPRASAWIVAICFSSLALS